MTELLSAAQLREVQKVAESGMTTPVTIYRRTAVSATAGNDYGDDDLAFDETTDSLRGTVKGWLFSTPTPVQVVDSGEVVTVNTYRLYVPVGTDIEPGDNLVIGSDTYTVSDTTGETTWPAVLGVSLRLRE